MSHRDQFGDDFSLRAGTAARGAQACSGWDLLLVDAAEGLLSEAEQAMLDRHVGECSACAQELADAQRGAAWLGLLKDHAPEPPPALLNNILAKTTGAVADSSAPRFTAEAAVTASWLPAAPLQSGAQQWTNQLGAAQMNFGAAHGQRRLFPIMERLNVWFGTGGYVPALQPRLAMTCAMAFFSICLTLNLLGISSQTLRAEALRPAGLQRTVADTGASLVRSFEGIRMVYRVESRVNEWRTASASQSEPSLDTSR